MQCTKKKVSTKLIKFVHQWKTWLLLMSEIGSPSARWPISAIFVHSIKSWRWKTFLHYLEKCIEGKITRLVVRFSFFRAVLTLAWHYYYSQLLTKIIKLSQAMWRINFVLRYCFYIFIFICVESQRRWKVIFFYGVDSIHHFLCFFRYLNILGHSSSKW